MNWKKYLSIGIGLAMIVVVAALAIPSARVTAQAPTPQPKTPQAAADRANNRLARLFQAALKLSERQGKALDRADTFSSKISDRIGKLKAAGKDPAALESALAQFKIKTDAARQKHAVAVGVLTARAGFNANGKVTNRAVARETLQSANPPLREARKLLAEGLKNLNDAVKGYRKANSTQTQT